MRPKEEVVKKEPIDPDEPPEWAAQLLAGAVDVEMPPWASQLLAMKAPDKGPTLPRVMAKHLHLRTAARGEDLVCI